MQTLRIFFLLFLFPLTLHAEVYQCGDTFTNVPCDSLKSEPIHKPTKGGLRNKQPAPKASDVGLSCNPRKDGIDLRLELLSVRPEVDAQKKTLLAISGTVRNYSDKPAASPVHLESKDALGREKVFIIADSVAARKIRTFTVYHYDGALGPVSLQLLYDAPKACTVYAVTPK